MGQPSSTLWRWCSLTAPATRPSRTPWKKANRHRKVKHVETSTSCVKTFPNCSGLRLQSLNRFFFQIIFQKTYSKDLLALMASLHLPNRSVACKVTTWNLENNSAHRCDLVESGKESLVSATTGGFGAASEQLFVYVKIFSPFFLVCFFTFNHSCHSCVFFHNFFMFTQLPKPQ